MTDQTPATEADAARGRLQRWTMNGGKTDRADWINEWDLRLNEYRDSIAAEARADADIECNSKIRDAEQRGRADECKRVTDAVRALKSVPLGDERWYLDRAAVLAILDPQP